jgi:hypothetical protein
MNNLIETYRKDIEAALSSPEDGNPKELKSNEITGDEELKPIINWLARLRLCYGVPFHYLAPLEKMLPVESIRFFYVDPDWITALLDGAYSIGRLTEGDAVDEQGSLLIHRESDSESQRIRSDSIKNHPEPEITPQPKITGFLLRSDIVAHYPGLEVDGYGSCKNPPTENDKLRLLRLERLAPNILLCLFKGELKRLELREPPEGIFFGFNAPEVGTFQKDFRNPKSLETDSSNVITVPLKDKNVVNILELAGKFAEITGKTISPSDFAVQMAQGVDKVIFEIDDTK